MHEGTMRIRQTAAALAAVAALALSAPTAHAFKIENKDASGGSDFAPKFDIEEQAKNFRKTNPDLSSSFGQRNFSTPLGTGTVEFGVRQGPSSSFGSPFSYGSGFGNTGSSYMMREHFNRIVTPENQR
jgi:hypothetical protein